jgi:hypothetical protein
MSLEYEITLNSTLSRIYKAPPAGTLTVSETDGDNNAVVALERARETTVGGFIGAGGSALDGAAVIITYTVGDETDTITALTGTDGRYEATLPAGARIGDIRVRKPGYVDYIWTPGSGGSGDIPEDIDLTKAEGLSVSLNMGCRLAVASGETPVTSPLADTGNLRFTVFNETRGQNIADFDFSGLSLILRDDTIRVDDTIVITAEDLAGNMTGARGSFAVQGNDAEVTLDFVQLGHWEARNITAANTGNMALLYDSAGKYVATSYTDGMNIIGGVLSEGQYDIVFIGRSELLRHIADLSDFASLGLLENTDYVRRSAAIEPGVVTVIGGLAIPALDEAKLYYTDPAQTFLTANKAEAPLGALITMRAEYAFAEKYAEDAAAQAIAVTLPEGCQLLANSVSVDGRGADYTNTGRGFEVSVTNPAGVVRFYVAQTTPGEHAVNAFLRFSRGGEPLLQSVGTMVLKAPALTLDVPNKTSNTKVRVSGLTERGSSVKVFDNGTEVGTAQTNALGNWKLSFELVEPSTYSRHSITAEVKTGAGMVVRSEAKTLIYNMAYTEVSKVTMIHNGQSVVFDFLDLNAKTPSYSYNPSHPDFTFLVEFTNPDVAVSDVVVVTQDNDGDFRRVATAYDSARKQWIGADSFATADIPVWVGADFTGSGGFIFPELLLEDDEEPEIDDELAEKIAELEKEYDDAVKGKDLAETTAYFERKDAEYKTAIEQAAQELASLQDDSVSIEQDEGGMTVTSAEGGVNYSMFIGTSAGLTEQALTGRGFEKAPTVNGGSVYVKAGETEICYADLKNNVYYEVRLPNLEDIPGYVRIDPDTPIESSEELKELLDNEIAVSEWLKSFTDTVKTVSKIASNIKAIDKLAHLDSKLVSKYFDDSIIKGASDTVLNFIKAHKENIGTFSKATESLAKRVNFLSKPGKLLSYMDYAVTARSSFINFMTVLDASMNIPENCDDPASKQQWKNLLANSLAYGVAQTAEVAFKVTSSALLKAAVAVVAVAASAVGTPAAGFSAGAATLAGGIFAQTAMKDWMGKVADDAEFELLYAVEQSAQCTTCTKDCACGCGGKGSKASGVGGANGRAVTPVIDPSGYIYEAVPSNRLPGVTVTAYKQDDGGPWNAADYDQENPLTTDNEGRYAWDVPIGQWQVRAAKTGYENAQSEWLPVPPPQTEVNIGMVSNAAPNVAYVSGFEDYIEIAFDRYMNISTLTPANIRLAGYSGYTVAFADEENNYARTARVIPPDGGAFQMGATMGVTVASAAKSYAGVGLNGDYQSDVIIKTEPRGIEAPAQVNLGYGETRTVTVSVLPAAVGAGWKVTAVSNSPIVKVDAESVTGAAGTAEFSVTGDLSGAAEISFALSNARVSGASYVTVALPKKSPANETTYHAITLRAGDGGTAVGGGSYAKDTVITVTAKPYDGYLFDGWYEGGAKISNAGAKYTFTVFSDRTLEARFTYTGTPDSGGTPGNGGTPGGGDTPGGVIPPDSDDGPETTLLPDGGEITLTNGDKFTVPPGTIIDKITGAVKIPKGGALTLPSGWRFGVPSGTTIDPNTGTVTLPEGGEITLPGGMKFIVPKSLIAPDSGVVTIADAGYIILPGADSELDTDDDVALAAPAGTTIHPYTRVTTTPDGSRYNPDGSNYYPDDTSAEDPDDSGGGCQSGGTVWAALLTASAIIAMKKRFGV